MFERINEISCYSSKLLIDYARQHGLTDEAIFSGAGVPSAALENPLEWTDAQTWSLLAANIEAGLGGEPGLLEKIVTEVVLKDIGSFQLTFLKMASLREIVKRVGQHVRTSVNKNLAVRIEVDKPGQADVYLCPLVPARFSKQMCDFNRGTVLAILRAKGYAEASVEELACCAQEGTNECHYRVRWHHTGSALHRIILWIRQRLGGQLAMVNQLEGRYRELRRQYEDMRRVESALRRSEARFRAVFQNILDLYFETTQDGRITEVSPSVQTLLGYRRDELYGVFIGDLFAEPEDRDAMMAKLAADSKVSDYEIGLRHRDGRVLTCSITAASIPDPDGKPYKLTGTARDITVRKQAELAVKESAERQRRIVQNMPVMLAAFDEENLVIAWNQECEKVTGYSAAEVVGKPQAIGLFAPGGEERMRVLGRLVRRPTSFRNREMELVCKDGTRRTILVSNISSEFPIAGWHAWAIGLDITERKQAEISVRESELKFRELADNIEQVFWLCSADWREAFYVSPAFATMCASSVEAFHTSPAIMLDMIVPEDRARFESHCRAVINGEVPPQVACEYRIRHPDGSERWLASRIYPIRNDRGEIARIAGIANDVTEQRRQVEEHELMSEQLRQAQKMDAIGQLAGGIAHDFNNQLAGIMGFAELLRDEVGPDSRLASYVDYILVGSRRAAELTAKLLAFARKGKYRSVPVNVHKVIAEVVSLLEHSIDKRIRILQLLSASPPVTIGDPTQLQNAMLNLGLNARDAMPEGGELTISTTIVDLDQRFCSSQQFDVVAGRYLCIEVKDTGTGMSEEIKKHLFEPFFTTKTEGKGTGMGLASVYGTARNHHGTVTLESTPGKGSTFRLFLPVAADEMVSEAGTIDRAVRGSATVLVIDDEETFRDMTVAALTSLGYRAVACQDGRAGLEYYRHAWKQIDLVLLDMVMPDLDGVETFKRLRETNPDVKVLLCSGYSVDGRAQDLLNTGARGFIEKPFRKAALSEKVAEVLSGPAK